MTVMQKKPNFGTKSSLTRGTLNPLLSRNMLNLRPSIHNKSMPRNWSKNGGAHRRQFSSHFHYTENFQNAKNLWLLQTPFIWFIPYYFLSVSSKFFYNRKAAWCFTCASPSLILQRKFRDHSTALRRVWPPKLCVSCITCKNFFEWICPPTAPAFSLCGRYVAFEAWIVLPGFGDLSRFWLVFFLSRHSSVLVVFMLLQLCWMCCDILSHIQSL